MSTRALHSHGHAVARKMTKTSFANHPIAAGIDGASCTGQVASPGAGSGGVWDPTVSNGRGKPTGAYVISYPGMLINGECMNVDGQSCGNDSVVIGGKCTPVGVNLSDTAIDAKNQKFYERWVKSYFILMDLVLKQYESDGVDLNGHPVDAKYIKAMEKYLGKERATMLKQISQGHAPAVFFKAVAQNSNDTNLYVTDLGGIPISTVMMAARDGEVPGAAVAAIGQEKEGISALKALNANYARVIQQSKQAKNPFPAPYTPPKFTTPSSKPPRPGVSAATPGGNWWDHDPMKAAGAAAIAASNANANADLQHAIDVGHLLDAGIAAGSVAYGGPYQSSDPEIPPAAGPEPTGNMAPQIQPGSGSQFTPPPPPPTYQMTGLGQFAFDAKSLVPIGIAFFLIYCLSKRR